MLAQGQYWRTTLGKGTQTVVFSLLKESLPQEVEATKDLRVEMPLVKWSVLVKHVLSDRKLVGGVLLDYAKPNDHLAAVIASDRLFRDLQNVTLESTAALVAQEVFAYTEPGGEEESG